MRGYALGWPLAVLVLVSSVTLLLVLPLWQGVLASLGLAAMALVLRPWLAKPGVSPRFVGFTTGCLVGIALAYLVGWTLGSRDADPQTIPFALLLSGGSLLGLAIILSRPSAVALPAKAEWVLAAWAALPGAAASLILFGILLLIFGDSWVD